NHLINKNIGPVAGRFVNSIDTVQAAGIDKTILLSSSANSRTITTPALISLNENRNTPEDALFNKANIPAAVLLEGSFKSLYRSRAGKSIIDSLAMMGVPFRDSSLPAKMIIAGDADLVLNDVSTKDGPLPMGINLFNIGSQYEYQFANREFLMNCLEYLTNKPEIIAVRNKDMVLRLLDTEKVKSQRNLWQFLNIGLPVLLVIFAGWVYQQIRRRHYTT
nr:gliding motility-associated ABC transporter substrate-binding protein GldG [Chitinophagaceae bacterium]